MPELDGKKYSYDKKGKAEYAKDLMKKLKKKKSKLKFYEDGDNNDHAIGQE